MIHTDGRPTFAMKESEILPDDVRDVLRDPLERDDQIVDPDPRSTDDDDGHLENDDARG